MISELNQIGFSELIKRRKENNKLFFIFPVFMVAYILLSLISMKGTLFFWATLPLFIVLYVLIGIYSPILAAKRFSKVISKISIEENNIDLQTEKVNFKKGIKVSLSRDDFEIKKSSSILYGSGSANGLIILTRNNERYYLIEKFIDNYKELEEKLIN